MNSCLNSYSLEQVSDLYKSMLRKSLQSLQVLQLGLESTLMTLETISVEKEIGETSLNQDEEKESLL